ncbi:hypothetical protein NEOC84_002010|nr:hypothetical protein [Neochlamydia sp. AcF95]NGY96074.1 hypothetical protein [Neochlamydia sp. AcF84]
MQLISFKGSYFYLENLHLLISYFKSFLKLTKSFLVGLKVGFGFICALTLAFI